jgi:excinuclease ABC subunit B
MVIMYADTITGSMQVAIDETNRRRSKQMEYNAAHGITPTTVLKSRESIMVSTRVADSRKAVKKAYAGPDEQSIAADPVVAYMDKDDLEKLMATTRKNMEKAAKELDFMQAARMRDELNELKKLYEHKA